MISLYIFLYMDTCLVLVHRIKKQDPTRLFGVNTKQRQNRTVINEDLFLRKCSRCICWVTKCVVDAKLFYQAIKEEYFTIKYNVI